MIGAFVWSLFIARVALGLTAIVSFLASFLLSQPWSKYLGMTVGIGFGVIQAEKIFVRLWPEPRKGWAE